MHKIALVTIPSLFTILLLWVTEPVFAWCPEYDVSVEKEYGLSKSVFTVLVEEEIPVIDKELDFIEGHVYILKALKWYKGSPMPMIVTYSENSSGRFNMEVGKAYLLFSEYNESPMVISNCGNSDLFTNSGDSLKIIQKLSGDNA